MGLVILNQGEELTFLTMGRQKVMAATLCSRKVVSEIYGCRILPKPPLSDDRHILFTTRDNKRRS
jgi:hypothetical protein